jgi:hypothetical protein
MRTVVRFPCDIRAVPIENQQPGRRLGTYDGGELVATRDAAAPGGPIVCREGDYAEAMADKRRGGDTDIEAQARRNLELLGGLGGGEGS